MGNEQPTNISNFSKRMSQFKSKNIVNKKYSMNPQKKYRHNMIQALNNSNLCQTLQEKLIQTIENKISNQQLIQTISRVAILKNNQFQLKMIQSTIINNKNISDRVQINFDKIKNQHQGSTINNQPKQTISQEIKIKIKQITNILRRQLRTQYHPFWRLCKTFSQYLFCHLEEIIKYPTTSLQSYQKDISSILWSFVTYLSLACINPYKKWISTQVTLPDSKLLKIVQKLFMQQIWTINHDYLFNVLQHIIMSHKVPLNIVYQQLHYNSPIITPTIFSIENQLAIQGHFFDGIYQCAQVEQITTPQNNLRQLQLIKHCICNDIDNYHRLSSTKQNSNEDNNNNNNENKNKNHNEFQNDNQNNENKNIKVYQIDSDNILGIIAYILCKIPNKIQTIYNHLIFLRIVYGDIVYYGMDISSYMLSTIFGALEYLESQNFRNILKKYRNQKKSSKYHTNEDANIKPSQCTSSTSYSNTKQNTKQMDDNPKLPKNKQDLVSSLLQTCNTKSQQKYRHHSPVKQ